MSDKSKDLTQFALRMPSKLADNLRKLAVKNNASMNAEIVLRLEESVSASTKEITTDETKASILETINEMKKLALKVSDLASKDVNLKEEFLNKEEKELLNWFNNANKNEQELLMNSLPELLSLLKKLS